LKNKKPKPKNRRNKMNIEKSKSPEIIEVEARVLEADLIQKKNNIDSIVEVMDINGDQELATALDYTKSLIGYKKQIDRKKKEQEAPHKQELLKITNQWKPLTISFSDLEELLRKKILAYQVESEKQKRLIEEQKRKEVEEEARKQAEEQLQQGEMTKAEFNSFNSQLNYAMTKPVEIEKVRGKETNSIGSVRKVWTYEITDIVALANARADLVQENSAMIRREIANGVRDIAGIKIYQKESLTIR
jgi:hypothetical protein